MMRKARSFRSIKDPAEEKNGIQREILITEAEELLSAAEKKPEKQATDRGTACHRMLELIHFSDISGCDDVKRI